jgi:hypothetical protein
MLASGQYLSFLGLLLSRTKATAFSVIPPLLLMAFCHPTFCPPLRRLLRASVRVVSRSPYMLLSIAELTKLFNSYRVNNRVLKQSTEPFLVEGGSEREL